MLRRIRPVNILTDHPFWHDGKPYVWDCKLIDITDTVVAGIRNAPVGLVAVSVVKHVKDHATVEKTAADRGAKVIWIDMRYDLDTIGFEPTPRYSYGPNNYVCYCPNCGWYHWSSVGMNLPERAYWKHWHEEHSGRSPTGRGI